MLINVNDLRPKGAKISKTNSKGAYKMYGMIQELSREIEHLIFIEVVEGLFSEASSLPCSCSTMCLMRNGCQCGGI